MQETKIVKLRYCEPFIVNVTAGNYVKQTFRLMNIYDPNYTGTGHQPMGFDFWSSLYNRYTVLGAKVTVRPSPIGNYGGTPMAIWLTMDREALPSVPDNAQTAEENWGQPSIWNNNANETLPKLRNRMTKYFSAKKFFDRPNDKQWDSMGTFDGASAPVNNAYFHCWFYSMFGSDPAQMHLMITIEYVVQMTDTKNEIAAN